LVKWWISGGLNPWMLTCGKLALISVRRSSYHSRLRCGEAPPASRSDRPERDGLADLLEQDGTIEYVRLGIAHLAIKAQKSQTAVQTLCN